MTPVLEIGLPVLFAILVWWLGTGVILYLDGRGRATFRASFIWTTAAALAAFAALALTRNWETPAGAYIAFTAAVVIWGWNEMSFLMGFIAGPNREPCPPEARGFRRFGLALRTVIDHELAIAVSGALIMLATLGGANQFGLWTFAVLWVMRISAKLNIFLGAPNVPTEFLPPHLAYLKSYFPRRPMNGFFPLAITAATLVTAFLVHMALFAGDAFSRIGYLLLTTMMALAVLEHWLLYIPLSATRLWSWGLTSHERQKAQGPETWPIMRHEPLNEPLAGALPAGETTITPGRAAGRGFPPHSTPAPRQLKEGGNTR